MVSPVKTNTCGHCDFFIPGSGTHFREWMWKPPNGLRAAFYPETVTPSASLNFHIWKAKLISTLRGFDFITWTCKACSTWEPSTRYHVSLSLHGGGGTQCSAAAWRSVQMAGGQTTSERCISHHRVPNRHLNSRRWSSPRAGAGTLA